MNGFRVMGRVMWSGTANTAWRLWWYQAAKAETGGKRAGLVATRAAGTVAVLWFGGGTLWALGALPYVLPAGWFVAVGVFADVEVGTDQALPSPTEAPPLEDEEAGQELEIEKGRIGKARVLKVRDPRDPARTHLVWLDKAPQKEAS